MAARQVPEQLLLVRTVNIGRDAETGYFTTVKDTTNNPKTQLVEKIKRDYAKGK
jgi:hypothetical protein